MSVPPATAVAQRLPIATPAWRRSASDGPGSSAEAGPGAATRIAGASVPSPVGSSQAPGPASRPLPVLPVSRRASAPASASGAHSGHDHGPVVGGGSPAGPATSGSAPSRAATSPGRASAGAGSPNVRPTVGARPLRPGVAVQREAAGASSPSARVGEAAPLAVAARWSPAGDLPATVEALPPAARAEDAVPLQRIPSGASTPRLAPAAAPAPVPMREMVFPAPGVASIPLASFAGLGDAGLPTLQRAVPSPGHAPTGLQASPSHAPLTLAHPAAASAGQSTAGGVPAPVLQRIVAGDASATGSGAAPAVQASRPAGSPIPDISVRPIVQRAESGGAPPGGAGAAGGRSEKELDELAQALFGRFRTRLRAEVIHEREARGLGFDAF